MLQLIELVSPPKLLLLSNPSLSLSKNYKYVNEKKRRLFRTKVNLRRSAGSPTQTGLRGPRTGVLLGTRRHRHKQLQRGASNGCKDAGAILANLESVCCADMLQLHTWNKASWSSSSHHPPLCGGMNSSHFRLIRTPHCSSFQQVCEQLGRCRNDFSSSRHTRMERVH